jgi:hypothetical protein
MVVSVPFFAMERVSRLRARPGLSDRPGSSVNECLKKRLFLFLFFP